MKNLFPFQTLGIEFLRTHRKALLADEMGCGKSVQSLIAAESTNNLILCPAGLRLNWAAEVEKWKPDAQVVILTSSTSTVQLAPDKQRFIICSHHYLLEEKNLNRLFRCGFGTIIVDEAHKLKNMKRVKKGSRGISKNFRRLMSKHKGKIWFLTGTPATRSGEDYYFYLYFLEPNQWGNRTEFREVFCERDDSGMYPTYSGLKPKGRIILREAFKRFTLRRLKKNVLPELPEKILHYQPVEVDGKLIAAEKGISLDIIREKILSGGFDRWLKENEHVMRHLRLIGMSKIESALEYMEGVEEPLVVFVNHTEVAHQLSTDALVLTGETKDKQEVVDAFQNGESNRIVCNIRAGGVGFNLHRSSHVLFVEYPWSPADFEQGIGRVHRIGQKGKCVHVTCLTAAGTIDEVVLEALRAKTEFMRDVMGDDLYE